MIKLLDEVDKSSCTVQIRSQSAMAFTWKHISVAFLVLVILYSRSGSRTSRNLVPYEDEPIPFLPADGHDYSRLYKSASEVFDPVSADVQGNIPKWLHGTLLRDGPGLFEFGEEKALHAFDGMAMIRRYSAGFGDSGPSMNYSRRLIQCDVLKEGRAQGKFTRWGVGTPVKGTTMLQRLKGLGSKDSAGDNMVVNTFIVHGRYYAVSENPYIIEYDPVTLETLGKVNVREMIPGLAIMTAHALNDKKDGTVWNLALATGPSASGESKGIWRYVVYKIPPPQTDAHRANPWLNLQIVAEVFSSRAISIGYAHSFFMTENYLVIAEQPWIIGDPISTIYNHVILGQSLASSMYWDTSEILKFHVLNKKSGEVSPIKYEADAFGFFHVINTFEEEGQLVLDAPFKAKPVSYNVFMVDKLSGSAEQVSQYMNDVGPAAGPTRRWVLPLSVPEFEEPETLLKNEKGQIQPNSYKQLVSLKGAESKAWLVEKNTVYLRPENLAKPEEYAYHRALEFAAVNPNNQFKKYRYAYGLGFPSGYLVGSVGKLDVEKKTFSFWWTDPGCSATEPQFVPRPGGTHEEDGVVVFACLGTENPVTHLVVLNPEDLREMGRFSVPYTTPVGFHGVWIS